MEMWTSFAGEGEYFIKLSGGAEMDSKLGTSFNILLSSH